MKVHLIGMGGIGMSGIAQLLLSQGNRVSGSDTQTNNLLQKIQAQGGEVKVGHSSAHLDHPDLVVYSSSIAPENPELVAARNRGIPVLHRGQMVAKLAAGRRVIAVTGAHGKSTTTGLIAQLLIEAGEDPLVLLGAEAQSFGSNARFGQGRFAVIEADESDGSLLWLKPHVAILTNLDEEHLDYFRNRWEIEETYRAFVDRLQPRGMLIGCLDDPSLMPLLKAHQGHLMTYGLSPKAQIRAEEIELKAGQSHYRCFSGETDLGKVVLSLAGTHNVVNSLSVVGLAQILGINFSVVSRALSRYPGAKRRFQIQGESKKVLVVEDYAHHPVEIEATLEAARSWKNRRIRCVFQPHRYSRTQHLLGRFGASFQQADQVILLPIYAASEDPVAGLTDKMLLQEVQAARGKGNSVVQMSDVQALTHLEETAKPQDLILFLGAGSIGGMAGQLAKRLGAKKGSNS